jgi:electron transfer flavoprotein beta subunit
MNIVVPVKLVPDLVEELEIAEDGTDLDRDVLMYKINEFCDHALEEALQLREAHGGTVTVLALERDETDKVLYTAIAKGADRAIKVTGVDAAAPTGVAAAAMCKVLEGLDYDLVLTGVQAADDRDGQLGVLIAARLGLPCVSAVSDVRAEGDVLSLHKEYAGGVLARFEVRPPAVLGIQAARETPRYAPVSRVRQVMKEAEIAEMEVDVGDVSAGSAVRRMFTPEKGAGAKMLEGDADEVAAQIAALLTAGRS